MKQILVPALLVLSPLSLLAAPEPAQVVTKQANAAAETEAAPEALDISAEELSDRITSSHWSVRPVMPGQEEVVIPEVAFNEDGTIEVIEGPENVEAGEAPSQWTVADVDGQTVLSIGDENMMLPLVLTEVDGKTQRFMIHLDAMVEMAIEQAMASIPAGQLTPEIEGQIREGADQQLRTIFAQARFELTQVD